MRGEWFEFRRVQDLFGTNHRPEIRGTDEASGAGSGSSPSTSPSRPKSETRTQRRLRGELPGILAWAVDGCLAWQHDGLGTAEAVTAATTDYRADMDTLGAFLEECCELPPGRPGNAADLYSCFTPWAERNGVRERLSTQAFGRRLTDRGFTKHRTPSARLWLGLELRDGKRHDG